MWYGSGPLHKDRCLENPPVMHCQVLQASLLQSRLKALLQQPPADVDVVQPEKTTTLKVAWNSIGIMPEPKRLRATW